MKKISLLVFVGLCAIALSGCQATNTKNSASDEAESAIAPEGATQDAVNTPPSPPEPTRPAGN